MGMTTFKTYIERTNALKNVKKAYRDTREIFQELGFSENDLEHPPFYNVRLFQLRDEILHGIHKVKQELDLIGLSPTNKEFDDYVQDIFKQINLETPLSDVDYKRDDSGDEDY